MQRIAAGWASAWRRSRSWATTCRTWPRCAPGLAIVPANAHHGWARRGALDHPRLAKARPATPCDLLLHAGRVEAILAHGNTVTWRGGCPRAAGDRGPHRLVGVAGHVARPAPTTCLAPARISSSARLRAGRWTNAGQILHPARPPPAARDPGQVDDPRGPATFLVPDRQGPTGMCGRAAATSPTTAVSSWAAWQRGRHQPGRGAAADPDRNRGVGPVPAPESRDVGRHRQDHPPGLTMQGRGLRRSSTASKSLLPMCAPLCPHALLTSSPCLPRLARVRGGASARTSDRNQPMDIEAAQSTCSPAPTTAAR